MTNSDRLQEIKERAEKATPPPWEVDSEMHPAIESADEQMRIYDEGGHGYQDAIFIAKAREDIPYLLQLVTEQQREIDRTRRTVSNLVGGMCEHKESCQYPQCKCGQPDEAKGYRKQERPI